MHSFTASDLAHSHCLLSVDFASDVEHYTARMHASYVNTASVGFVMSYCNNSHVSVIPSGLAMCTVSLFGLSCVLVPLTSSLIGKAIFPVILVVQWI